LNVSYGHPDWIGLAQENGPMSSLQYQVPYELGVGMDPLNLLIDPIKYPANPTDV